MPTFTSTDTNPAVVGQNTDNGIGVLGTSVQNDAVHGNTSSSNAAGVSGFNTKTDAPAGPGVLGVSVMGVGVHGHSSSSAGIVGDSDAFDGVGFGEEGWSVSLRRGILARQHAKPAPL